MTPNTNDTLTSNVKREAWEIRDIHEGIQEADAGEFATDEQVRDLFAKYGAPASPGLRRPRTRACSH